MSVWRACAWLLVAVPLGVVGLDLGFHLNFQTSSREVQDAPCTFSRPPPPWLTGTLIRNGVGQFEMGRRRLTHVFDAFAKLSSVKIHGNHTASFSTRFLRSNFYRDSLQAGSVAPYLLFQSADPPFSLVERMVALVRGMDNPDANGVQFDRGDFLALSDFWKEYRFDPRSLETTGSVSPRVPGMPSWERDLPLPVPSSSHPIREHATRNYINFATVIDPLGKASLNLIRIRSTSRRELIVSIPLDNIPYMHSFALTTNYAALFVNPLSVDLKKMALTAEPVKSLDWKPRDPTTVYVINIHTAKVMTYQTSAAFDMHHVNAFEDGSKLYIDCVTYPNITFLASLQVKYMLDPSKRNSIPVDNTLRRYVIDLQEGNKTMSFHTFPADQGLEFVNRLDFPTINEDYRHKPYCFVWGVVGKSDGINFSNATLVKKDLCRKSRDVVWHHADHYPSEARFVARPGGRSEDDGVLTSLVLAGDREKSYLGVWNATTMQLMTQSDLPVVVPFSLHGRFFEGVQ